MYATPLPHRTALRLSGPDRQSFLQSLVSNDVAKATDKTAIYAALLTPQGKFLHDLFILADGDSYLIDCESARAEDLIHRLTAYKLRAKITIENLSDSLDIWALAPQPTINTPRQYQDPRLPEMGSRLFAEKTKPPYPPTPFSTYDQHRLRLGLPDGSRDLEIEKSTLAEGNFDLLKGIDWKKGCYVGQELTARMHYRGLAKKRLFPVKIDGDPPPPKTLLPHDGEMRSANAPYGLALLRLDAAQQPPITWEKTTLCPQIPPWMKIDAAPTTR